MIPPISSLKWFGHGQFHLLLSHLMENEQYKAHYRKQREQGAYLVLDNSAHEFTAGESAEKLLVQALAINAQEIVVPDVLFEYQSTVEGTVTAWEAWTNSFAFSTHNPALMYVPQGADVQEWNECLTEQVRIHKYATKNQNLRKDFVVGISKDYEIWDGGLTRLIDDFIHPLVLDHRQKGIKVQVHLLGWGRNLWALQEIALRYPWVRSTDSAKPFVYAMSGIRLDPANQPTPPEYPRRPPDYFKKKLIQKKMQIAEINAMVFRMLARDTPFDEETRVG